MKTLTKLKTNFLPLTDSEQNAIKGGGTPLSNADLQALFNYSGIGGFNSAGAAVINAEMQKIAMTAIGGTLLHELISSLQKTGTKITLVDDKPTGAVAAFYRSSTKTLDFSNFAAYNIADPVHDARALDVLAHEIFHAWDSIFNNKGIISDDSNHEITLEVDAILFSGFVEKQLDTVTGKNFYYKSGAQSDLSMTTVPPAYKTAYEDIVGSNHFNLKNYDALIDNLKAIYHNPAKPNTGYDTMKTDHPKTLATDGLYGKLYTGSVVPATVLNAGNVASHPAPAGSKSQVSYSPQGSYGSDDTSTTTSTSTNAWHFDPKTGTYFDDYGNTTGDPSVPPPPAPTPAPTTGGSGSGGSGGNSSSGAGTGTGSGSGSGGGGGGGSYYVPALGDPNGNVIYDSPVRGKVKDPDPTYYA